MWRAAQESSITVMTGPRDFSDVRRLYTARCDEYAAKASFLASQSRRLSNLRLVFFFLCATGVVVGLWSFSAPRLVWLLVGAGSFAVFVGLITLHRRVSARCEHARALERLNVEALARLERDWRRSPEPRIPQGTIGSTIADDLDLFGRASLYSLLGPVWTPAGESCLARWLLQPASAEEVIERQQAVAELAPELDLRQDMMVRGRALGNEPPSTDRFLRWAKREPWLWTHRGLIWITRGLPLICLGLLVAHLGKLVAYPLWLVPLFINIAMTRGLVERVHGIFNEASLGEQAFHHYAELFAVLEALPAESTKLRALKTATSKNGLSAYRRMRRLNQIMHMADVRYSPMSYMLLQALTLWDFHILFMLERWQCDVGDDVARWLAALGEFEALAALAGLAHDHPSWVFPTITGNDDHRIVACEIGHPLLHPEVCVTNDVELGPPGSFLLVTGSNMSGKSTLLRAIGMNVTLALAGGPVCARLMHLPPVVLGTSFRVRDSIEDGVSYFMAELNQLKHVIDRARLSCGGSNAVFLYLLDEVLLGTNVRERQIAVQRVVRYLVEQEAIGAVATHDLSLADAPLLAQSCRPAHFSEQFADGPEGPVMTFDYVLRPGLSTSTNALKLLQMVGLDIAGENG